MRKKEELDSAEFNDNMDDLVDELVKRNIPFEKNRHRGANPVVKESIGYYPTGEWQIMIEDKYSVIRGMASFGLYEIYGGKYSDPERFESAKELVDDLAAPNHKE